MMMMKYPSRVERAAMAKTKAQLEAELKAIKRRLDAYQKEERLASKRLQEEKDENEKLRKAHHEIWLKLKEKVKAATDERVNALCLESHQMATSLKECSKELAEAKKLLKQANEEALMLSSAVDDRSAEVKDLKAKLADKKKAMARLYGERDRAIKNAAKSSDEVAVLERLIQKALKGAAK